MDSSNDPRKIVKAFYSVGLNESKITKYDDEGIELKYVQKIDIVEKALSCNSDEIYIEEEDEKWTRVIKDRSYWLRMQYSIAYEDPITNFKIAECSYDSSGKYLLLSKEHIEDGYKPVEFSVVEKDSVSYIKLESEDITAHDSQYCRIPSHCDMKDKLQIPFKSQAAALLVTRSFAHLPIKDIKIKRSQTSYQFGLVKHKSPFQYTYLPEIMDTYPLDTPLNPGIAMFCFPEGLKIKKAFDTPKWFSFILTDETGFRTYGTVLIFTEDLSRSLIKSLIPIYKTKDVCYIEKAICVLSHYPFFHNNKAFLKEIYRTQVSHESLIPLERIICHYVDSLYFQTVDKMLSLKIGIEDLKFYRVPIYGREWDINDDSLEVLFTLLSFDTILTVWEALLLERKVFMLCSSKSVLLNISMALISLLFPFQWMHILVPILPEKLKVFLEAPVPLLVGINFSIDFKEFPDDAIILNIEKNAFENDKAKLPRLPSKLLDSLMKKVSKLKDKYHLDQKQEGMSNRIKCNDDVFPIVDMNSKSRIDCPEIRDVFYEFFISLFKNYEAYFNWKKKGKDEPLTFLRDVFLKDHSSTDPGSFLYSFCDTSLFSQFGDSFNYMQSNNATAFFIDSIKNGKGKAKSYLLRKVPLISTVIPDLKVDDLKGRLFTYKSFPMLDTTLYFKTEVPRALYQTRFMYMRDEWCYDLLKLSHKDLAKYLMYSIYEIWFTLFSFIIHFYDDKKAQALMEHAMFLIEDLIHRQNITPSKNLLTKLIKSCGRSCLTSFTNPLLNLVNSSNQKFNALFHNAFMNGLYALTENLEFETGKTNSLLKNSLLNSVKLNGSLRLSCIKLLNLDNIQSILEGMTFLLHDLCPHCLNESKGMRKISIEEILAGFSRGKSDFASCCPSCLNKIFPKLYLFDEGQPSLEVDSVNFLSPIVLVKEIDNLIKNNGEKYFYHEEFHKDKYHRNIFWNLGFYFQLFNLPLCVMFLQNNEDKFKLISSSLAEAKKRRSSFQMQSNPSQGSKEEKRHKYSTTCDKEQLAPGIARTNTYKSKQELKDDLWKGIRAKMEKSANLIKDFEKPVDKNDLNLRLSELRMIISGVIKNFLQSQHDKLECALLRMSKDQIQIDSNKNAKTKNISIVIDTTKVASSIEKKKQKEEEPADKKETDSLNLINLKDKFFSISPKGKTQFDIKLNLDKAKK